MLDPKQHHDAETVEKGLGLGIRFACTVGQGRQIEMTAGVPLDWKQDQINDLLDKLATGMDRQSYRYQLHDMKAALEQTERELSTNRQQLANFEDQCAAEFSRRGKNGEFRYSENQEKQRGNYANTEQRIVAHIEKLRKDIKDAEAKCL